MPTAGTVVLVEGESDREAVLALASARAEIVDGAGHFLQVERPEVVNELIADHLR